MAITACARRASPAVTRSVELEALPQRGFAFSRDLHFTQRVLHGQTVAPQLGILFLETARRSRPSMSAPVQQAKQCPGSWGQHRDHVATSGSTVPMGESA